MRRTAQLLFLTLFLCHSIVAGAASVTCAVQQAAADTTEVAQPCHGTSDHDQMPSGDAADQCVCAAACMGSALLAVAYPAELTPLTAPAFATLSAAAHSADPVFLIRPPIA